MPSSVKSSTTMNQIHSNILECIGDTPIVRINRIGKEEGVDLVKCEYFNAGGSVKDRIAKKMIEKGIAEGKICKENGRVVEATSGNTGIGLGLACAVHGLECVICIPEKMSMEKVNLLKALGTIIYRTPTEAASSDPESNIGVANRICAEAGKGAFQPDQYSNEANPQAHYEGTAEEILNACDGRVDMIVLGAGTGGTISGVGRKLKEKCPGVIIVGVDPFGSILSQIQEESKDEEEEVRNKVAYLVEGIGYDFVPKVLDRDLVDHWIQVSDRDSFRMARRLIKSEGLLCGGSSGAAMFGAINMAKRLQLSADKRIVVLLPDSVRNYMSKFVCDDWMLIHNYIEPFESPDFTLMKERFGEETVPLIDHSKINEPVIPTLMENATGHDVKKAFEKNEKIEFALVKEFQKEEIIGVIHGKKFDLKVLGDGPGVLDSKCRRFMEKEFKIFPIKTPKAILATNLLTGYPIFLQMENKNLFLLKPQHF